MIYHIALLLLSHLAGVLGEAVGCTTIVVGAKATVDGSPIVTHSADSCTGDFRVAYVPSRDHAPGAKRTVTRWEAFFMTYPRSTDTERSASYVPVDNPLHGQEILGYIPQVRHTYALWESMYGLMNEHGLALGESTCCGNLVNIGVAAGGTALFTVSNLMAIALERCRTALCAVETMGLLAEKYGFYGEDAGIDGAGEAVTAADAEGDAWVFHVTGGVNGTGALWVAQRVPEGHVAVVANSFSIKEVDLDDSANFRSSVNLLDNAKASGFWDGKGRFDWQAAMSADYDTHFEASANTMDPLRMWRVFHLANPELNLKPSNRLADMPFSVAPAKKVSNLMVMNWHRDTYDKTEFDMTLGALAGPWQSPRRHRGGSGKISGQTARSVSMHWTLYCIIAQPGLKHPVLWFAPDSAKTAVFVPFYSEVLSGAAGRFSMKDYGVGSQRSFSFVDTDNRPAWWAFNFVADWLELSYHNMSQTFVYPKVQQLQEEVILRMEQGEAEADKAEDHAVAGKLASLHTGIQEDVVKTWWTLAENLVVTYNDQMFNTPTEAATVGYSDYWLQMTGYNQRSYYPGWMQPSKEAPSLLSEDELALAKKSLALGSTCGAVGLHAADCKSPTQNFLVRLGSTVTTVSPNFAGTLFFGAACAAVGFWAGASRSKSPSFQASPQDGSYLRIGD